MPEQLHDSSRLTFLRPPQVIGDLVVPELLALDRDTYIRQVSGTVGLSALAATVVRVAPALLFGLCSAEAGKPEPILGDLGQLERHILWQLARAENWKRDQEVAKEAAKGIAGPDHLFAQDVTVPGSRWVSHRGCCILLQHVYLCGLSTADVILHYQPACLKQSGSGKHCCNRQFAGHKLSGAPASMDRGRMLCIDQQQGAHTDCC